MTYKLKGYVCKIWFVYQDDFSSLPFLLVGTKPYVAISKTDIFFFIFLFKLIMQLFMQYKVPKKTFS